MPDQDNVVSLGSPAPGRELVAGTDLEVVFNRRGDDLVVRVNKGGVQIFRVLLASACKEMDFAELARFSPLSPDQVFTIGDMREGVERALQLAGLSDRAEPKR